MEHVALYRKWRPLTFEDVVEQRHIVTTLKNSIKMNTVNHAYLFCGTRGTGKTTMAKIFARAINCQVSKDGNPCNECVTCKGILDGSILDVIEIDAASNNGVDDIREIKEAVMYVPAITKYKVYIIDEVHMLSTGAFNALLKTLEEPPSNVIFILATTEPHKLPATILSRCQRFDFKRITIWGIQERLDLIAKDCGIDADQKALRLIARLSEGGMRDAISLLDQCIGQGAKYITYEIVAEISGLTASEAVNDFANAILNKNSSLCLRSIKDAMDEGRDLVPLCNQLIEWFRNLMLFKTGGEALNLIDLDKEELEDIEKASNLITIKQNIEIITEISKTEAQLKWAHNPRIIMEVMAVKLCSDIPKHANMDKEVMNTLSAFEDRIRRAENMFKSFQGQTITKVEDFPEHTAVDFKIDESDSKKPESQKYIEIKPALKESGKENISAPEKGKPKSKKESSKSGTPKPSSKILPEWPIIIETIRSMRKMKVYAYLTTTQCVLTEDMVAYIILSTDDDSMKEILSRNEHGDIIKDAMKQVLGVDVRVKILNKSENSKIDSFRNEKNKARERKGPIEANEDLGFDKVKQIAEQNGIPLEIKN